MYLGCIVERGTVDEVLRNPCHQYTQACCRPCPARIRPKGGRQRSFACPAKTPSPVKPPAGVCHFTALRVCAAALSRGLSGGDAGVGDAHQ